MVTLRFDQDIVSSPAHQKEGHFCRLPFFERTLETILYRRRPQTELGGIGIPGNLEARTASTGSHTNTWGAIGIPGNLEARTASTGSHRNTWGAVGIPGNLEAENICYRNTWGAIGIPGEL